MRLIERRPRAEQRFSNGEPALEPPEELCVAEWDAELTLEEDLDCDLVAEDDVEEGLLQETLEDLVHAGDGHPAWVDGPDEFRCRSCQQVQPLYRLGDARTGECRRCSG